MEKDKLPSAADLPDLTDRQMRFVKGILDGLTASDAYRQAYTTENMQDHVIWVRASELQAKGKVRVWLDAAKTMHLHSGKTTIEGHLAELDRLKRKAEDSGQMSAAIHAEISKGKAVGLYVERIRNEEPDESTFESALDRLLSRAAGSPSVTEQKPN